MNARVSFAMEWIDQTVCKLSEADPSELADFNCAPTTEVKVEDHNVPASLVYSAYKTDFKTTAFFDVGGCAMVALILFATAVRKLQWSRVARDKALVEHTLLKRDISDSGLTCYGAIA